MDLNLSLFAYGGFSHTVEQQLPDLNEPLKAVSHKLPRRSDRLTQLCLLGLRHTPDSDTFEAGTHLVLASGDANLNSTILNSEQIFDSGTLPNPIGFINTVNNSTAYHLCVSLGIQGQAISVSRDHCSLEAGLQIAATLQHSDPSPILLGTVDEIPNDPQQHRRRLHMPPTTPLAEGSFWFHCGHPQQQEPPIATIEYCGPMRDSRNVGDFLRERQISHHLLGDLLRESALSEIQLPGERLVTQSQGHYLTQNADYLQRWLDSARPGERLGLLNNTSGSKRLTVTLILKR
ncbi:MAG: hypothetical protein N0C88_09430 [Candidatus Thiodiazotropha lotti]|uniref:Beta-ketoacyl synthase N-terminal domain-containing protein n=1 Tax=Candidatus Thiodiazotropha lotti TaxID=2792787 RepID=A0A9E4K439_9GAMM|nr:hypothetical protein [Candidatus Thiodiazotropha lotti]MCW4203529.1 hypothetical protein [Candidatus Thiodiazotropha lotti]ODC00068.1 hypothetical protein A3197_06710 [Candidatus Thiodiazotropha endoloripes]